jgi:hypothetical protein
MFDGYNPQDQFAQDTWLEEFIVEYVDDAMDPCTRKAFEEYLAQNPQLADQVAYMRNIRQMMCGLNCGCAAPVGFQSRLRNQVACEMMKEKGQSFSFQSLHFTSSLMPNMLPTKHLAFGLAFMVMVIGGFYNISIPSSSFNQDNTEVVNLQSHDPSALLLGSIPEPLHIASNADLETSNLTRIRFAHQVPSFNTISSTRPIQLKAYCSCNYRREHLGFK